jgi:hypothetical protein
MNKTLRLTAVAIATAAAPLAPALANVWTVTRDIIGDAESTQVVSVPLDDAVFALAQDRCADVRVQDADGREIPRVIQPTRDFTFEPVSTMLQTRLEQVEPLADGGLAVVCKLDGTNAVSLTKMAIRTPLRNFEQTVTLQVMDAAGAWVPVKPAEPLFDYSRFADVKKDTVDLPGLTNRLFKIVIGKADDSVFSTYTSMSEESGADKTVRSTIKRYAVERRPFRIDGVNVWETRNVPSSRPRLDKVAVTADQLAVQTEGKTTTLTVPAGRHPLTGVVIRPEQENFERRVSIEAPAPGGWRTLANGAIQRVRLPGVPAREQLDVGFPEAREERLQIKIANDDNPPLTFGDNAVTLVRPAYAVSFIAEPGQRYRLVYGNPSPLAPPVYESGVVRYLNEGRSAASWALEAAPDAPAAYSAAVKARQFLARHALLLVSIIVMAVLGLLILRAAKTPQNESRSPDIDAKGKENDNR